MSDKAEDAGNSLIYAYVAIGVQAVIPIVLGSYASVKTPAAIRKLLASQKITPAVLDPDADDEDDLDIEERLNLTDSLMFPVFGSVTLLGLFLLFKYGGAVWINRILGAYFAFAGIAAVQTSFSGIVDSLISLFRKKKPLKYHFRIERGFKQLYHIPLTLPQLSLIPISLFLPILYIALDKPWYLTNVLSFAFAQTAIAMLKLDGFKTGGALLSGLFFYDIFWVFGSTQVFGKNVMVTVAKGLDAPIKILVPRNIWNWEEGFTMLGLGDIVIPGIFISLALRYDYSCYVTRSLKMDPKATPTRENMYPKPYFWTVLVAYIAGLVTTVVVMHTFKAAQPALLYLSPACIGAVALLSLIRGEFGTVWSWSDETFTGSSNPGEGDDLVEQARRIAAADIETPSVVVVPAEPTKEDVTMGGEEGDEEWMKVDEDGAGGKGKKGGKGGKGKKKK